MNDTNTATVVATAPRKSKTPQVNRAEIKLETGIPIPECCVPSNDRSPYPLDHLEPGASFSFPLVSRRKEQQLRSVNQSIYSYRKKNPSKQFIARVVDGEQVIRTWRIDKPAADKGGPECCGIAVDETTREVRLSESESNA